MQYFVHGVDSDAATEQLDRFAEEHWAYMDGYADDLVARGPTLSPDGEAHTGSIHLLSTTSVEEARRFAFSEPYQRAGVYASVTVTRFHNALSGTMWDRPLPPPGSTSSLVLVTWRARPFDPAADSEARVLRQLAETHELVFGGLLVSDDAAMSLGVAAAFDAGVEEASSIVAGISLPEPTTPIIACRWQRGGRNQG